MDMGELEFFFFPFFFFRERDDKKNDKCTRGAADPLGVGVMSVATLERRRAAGLPAVPPSPKLVVSKRAERGKKRPRERKG